jgi:hypothetical protein
MTGDEMARQQHDADLLEDLELDAEAGDGVRGGATADPVLSKTPASVLSKDSSTPTTSKTTPSAADLLKSSLDKL